MLYAADQDFLRGVYRTTTWLSALIFLVLLQTLDARIVGGFVLGVVLGVGLLRALQWAVQTAFKPEATRGERVRAVGVTLGKYGVVGVLFWLVLGHRLVNPFALLGGLVIPQAVIFLHTVSVLLIERLNRHATTPVKTPKQGDT